MGICNSYQKMHNIKEEQQQRYIELQQKYSGEERTKSKF